MSKTKTLSFLVILIVVVGGLSGAGYWHMAAPSRTCGSCHEIVPAHDLWAESPHREVACEECHGTAVSNGFHSLWQNARRVRVHVGEPPPPASIRLTEEQVVEMNERCRGCHEREYADWLSSGHSATYSDIFLNAKHNQMEQPMDDCLRCHGMFLDGNIDDVVTPLDNKGPWRMVDPLRAKRPVIPCLACHEVHFKGQPATRPDYSDPKLAASRRPARVPRAGFYDRNEKSLFEAASLAVPVVRHGDRALQNSTDDRQRVCVQCHAPSALRLAGSSDDRTPRGVHEGLSCLACHNNHSLDARPSCKECHPRLSNCGLDVEKMDTTFKTAQSGHNVHWVGCAECHPKGVPPRKPRRTDG